MELRELSEAVIDISRKAGGFILNERNKVGSDEIELKSLNSLVSYVDQKAEEMIVGGLKEILPEAGFIAEEGTSTYRADRYNWVVDPLDGTTNFLHGIPVFAISIALMDGEELVLGVVYELGQDEMFSAWKGGGAFLNGQPISVSRNKELKDCLLATGFPYYDFGRMDGFLDLLKLFFEKTRGVRRLGSAATDLAYVACGRFDGFFEYGLSPWDVAAGALIVNEAGGRVTDYKGGTGYIFGGEIAAGNPKIFEEFLGYIQQEMNR